MPRKMGPLKADHPLVNTGGEPDVCHACGQRFRAGDYVTLVALGPGDDPETRDKARRGVPYNAVALPVHWACHTGEERLER